MGNCWASKDKRQEAYSERYGIKITTKNKKLISNTETISSLTLDSERGNPEEHLNRSDSQKVSLESFSTLKLIGKGAYGKVFLVEEKLTK